MSLVERFYKVLGKLEGGNLHRNSGETDITTGYGIYRGAHPNEPVFNVIDNAAKSAGIVSPSSEWNKDDINKVNGLLEGEYSSDYMEATEKFYKKYFEKVSGIISKLPGELEYAYKLIYLNSNKLANKALQMTTNTIISRLNRYGNYGKPLVVDGIIGSNSIKAMDILDNAVTSENELTEFTLATIFLIHCKGLYVDLGTDEIKETGTDKHLKFLRGWDNRVDLILEEI